MCMTKEIQPQQYRARKQADRQPKQPPAAQGDPHGQRRDHHGVQKRRVHHGAHENQAAQGDPHKERKDPHGVQKRRVHHGVQENVPHAAKAEAEKPQVQQYITIQNG